MIPQNKNFTWLLAGFLIFFAFSALARHTLSRSFYSLNFFTADPSERYFEIKELMQKGLWKQANTQTVEVALSVSGRSDEGWFDDNAVKRFPCSDLYYIDAIFRQHSDGKFGFSAQKKVYEKIVAKNPDLNEQEIYIKFATAVGWIKNDKFVSYPDLFFDIDKAPKGHLPVKVPTDIIRPSFKSRHGKPDSPRNFSRLMERVNTCSPAS